MSPTSANMTLAQQVQDLPQELFDIIYDYVFTVPEDDARVITADYEPPAILQVDRDSRQRLAPAYYGSPWVFELEMLIMCAVNWIVALPQHRLDMITQLHISDGTGLRFATKSTTYQSLHAVIEDSTASSGFATALRIKGITLPLTKFEVSSMMAQEWKGVSAVDMLC